jgi:hypothetical protein
MLNENKKRFGKKEFSIPEFLFCVNFPCLLVVKVSFDCTSREKKVLSEVLAGKRKKILFLL